MWCAMKMESIAPESESRNTSSPMVLIWLSMVPIVANSKVRFAFRTASTVESQIKKNESCSARKIFWISHSQFKF